MSETFGQGVDMTVLTPTHKFDLPHSMREQQAVWAERTHFGTHLTKYRLGSVGTCQASFATGTLHLQGEEEKEIRVSFVSVLYNFLLARGWRWGVGAQWPELRLCGVKSKT